MRGKTARFSTQLPLHSHYVLVRSKVPPGNFQHSLQGTYYDASYSTPKGFREESYATWYKVATSPLSGGTAVGTEEKALARLADSVKGAGVNVAQMFAERHQTASLLTSTFERVVKAAFAVRRGDLGSAAAHFACNPVPPRKMSWERVPSNARKSISNALNREKRSRTKDIFPSGKWISDKDFSNAWLEYKYGWKPLLQDMHDAQELLNEQILGRDFHDAFKASASGVESNTKDVRGYGGSVLSTWHSTVRYSLHLRCEDELSSLASKTGLSNPALLAWELLPYSFVVDWVYPVGEYLEGLHAFDGFSFVRGTKSVTTKGMYFVDYTGPVGYTEGIYRFSGKQKGIYFDKYLEHQRTVLGSMPSVLPPKLKMPFKDAASFVDRFATSVSLIRALFRR